MSKEWKEKLLGGVRLPTPPPGRPQTTKSGKKGYDRKEEKKEVKKIIEENKDD